MALDNAAGGGTRAYNRVLHNQEVRVGLASYFLFG